jgi:hypothetical protein
MYVEDCTNILSYIRIRSPFCKLFDNLEIPYVGLFFEIKSAKIVIIRCVNSFELI